MTADSFLRRQSRLRQLYVLLPWSIALLTVTFLHFSFVSSTEVVIDLKTKGALFTLEEHGGIMLDQVEAIHIGGLGELTVHTDKVSVMDIDGRRSSGRPRETRIDPIVPVVIRPRGETQARVSGAGLGLTRLDLQKRAPIEIYATSGSRSTITIRQQADYVRAVIGTGTSIMLECDVCDVVQEPSGILASVSKVALAPNPREMQFSGTKRADVALLLPHGLDQPHNSMMAAIRVSSVDFTGPQANPPESLVDSGSIIVTELDGYRIPIEEQQFVVIDGLHDFFLSRLVLGPVLGIRFEGRVRSIMTGSGRKLYSRMPTRLQWIRKNEPLAVFIAAVTAVVGFLVSALTQLKLWNPKKEVA